ncbi:hypothetical protein KIN20_015095 [Parelaphostrongylus tenuis]|uniref:Uncharacterized protein n=1 Tax=Parelaphostrongylus tenuis TaxID=148309 RepID=A0AAD5MY23_PARTN|nr:hypothetical protein KIN20_015095 [Parelaphostrongylus tenuis]
MPSHDGDGTAIEDLTNNINRALPFRMDTKKSNLLATVGLNKNGIALQWFVDYVDQ